MDLFRWKRTLLGALGPALLCALLAAWGVYALTAEERPTYRSFALLNSGIMSNRDIGGAYNRDLVINELENLMNLARSFETREELAARLLARYLSLRGPDAAVISARAYRDLAAELDAGIVARHGRHRDPDRIYASIVAERDSLRRFGEAEAQHPLLALLYGDDPLIGAEQLARLRVNRKGMSDLLELSYSTVDAAWAKATLDLHIDIFLRAHGEVKSRRRSGALAYFQEATERSRATLDGAEERLRRFATRNKIINYYEQTRYIASLKNQVDHRYTEEEMKGAAADSTLGAVEAELAERTDLIRLNNLVDDRRRELGELSREEVRLEIMTPDSLSADAAARRDAIAARMRDLRAELSDDVAGLQLVHHGPEGLALGRLIGEWLAATLQVEEARGRLEVLDSRKIDFNRIYTQMADLGATIKKIEREVHIAEEDYLENLRNLNEALQKEHAAGGAAELRLVDAPVLASRPERSKRLVLVAVGLLVGGAFPLVLALALELLSGALLSFAEAERRSALAVVGGVARWGRRERTLRAKSRAPVRATTADLLWQGLRSRGGAHAREASAEGPHVVAVTSFRPGAGKSYLVELLAERFAARGIGAVLVDSDEELGRGADLRELAGYSPEAWRRLDVVLWEVPALATGRMPVGVVRAADEAILVHPAVSGWQPSHEAQLTQLREALGQAPVLALNGLPLDVLLHEWGATLRQVRDWFWRKPPAPEPRTPEPRTPAPLHWEQAFFDLPEEPTTPAPIPEGLREEAPAALRTPAPRTPDWEAQLFDPRP